MRGATAVTMLLTVAITSGLRLAGQQEARAPRAPALDALAEAERAFSRLSGRVGAVPAFLAYFADDVVTFGPAPATGKDGLRAAAASAAVPPAKHLDWEPWFADISDAGDLGYTTGPTLTTEVATGKTLRTGWYFSVWRHDRNGWRVAADIGIEAPAPGPLRPRALTRADVSGSFPRPGRKREEILAAERQMNDEAARAGVPAAYARYVGSSARLYRDGVSPLVGASAITAFLTEHASSASWQTIDASISETGDIGFSYGLYAVAPGEKSAPGKGGFLHVWKSGPVGWRLAAEVMNLEK